jgi:hypothetical protein
VLRPAAGRAAAARPWRPAYLLISPDEDSHDLEFQGG